MLQLKTRTDLELETLFIKHTDMAKQKNTANKKKHTKLLNQKKNKKQEAKELNKLRLKEISRKANELKGE